MKLLRKEKDLESIFYGSVRELSPDNVSEITAGISALSRQFILQSVLTNDYLDPHFQFRLYKFIPKTVSVITHKTVDREVIYTTVDVTSHLLNVSLVDQIMA